MTEEMEKQGNLPLEDEQVMEDETFAKQKQASQNSNAQNANAQHANAQNVNAQNANAQHANPNPNPGAPPNHGASPGGHPHNSGGAATHNEPPTANSPPNNPHMQKGGNPHMQQMPNIPISNEHDVRTQLQNALQQLAIAQTIAAKEKIRCDEMSNLVTRTQADFDNYRKRTNETSKKLKEEGVCEVLEKVIPILDVIKQAIMMITDEKVAEGVKMIYRQINDMLASFGVTEIPALGEMFDPNLHNAVMQVKVKDVAKIGMVIEVFNKGYRIGEKILRYSVVKVAK